MITNSADVEKLAGKVADTEGVYMVPAFVGLGAPYWDQYARGAIVGLTRGSTIEHIARATVDSMAYQTREVLEAMEADSGVTLTELKVDGGAVVNNDLMQFQADILGVAGRAAAGRGDDGARRGVPRRVWRSGSGRTPSDVTNNWALDRRFEPQMDEGEAREAVQAAGRRPCSARSTGKSTRLSSSQRADGPEPPGSGPSVHAPRRPAAR